MPSMDVLNSFTAVPRATSHSCTVPSALAVASVFESGATTSNLRPLTSNPARSLPDSTSQIRTPQPPAAVISVPPSAENRARIAGLVCPFSGTRVGASSAASWPLTRRMVVGSSGDARATSNCLFDWLTKWASGALSIFQIERSRRLGPPVVGYSAAQRDQLAFEGGSIRLEERASDLPSGAGDNAGTSV